MAPMHWDLFCRVIDNLRDIGVCWRRAAGLGARDRGVRQLNDGPPPLRRRAKDGKPFARASLPGGPVFVYFGYTHCPDVCPTTLADVRAGIRQTGVPAKVVFATVDPARDDAAAMKQYVAGFPPAAVARDQLPFAKAELSTHDNQRVTKALNDGLQAALTGAKTPEQAMKDAQREAERLLRSFK